jgi:TonB family protein
VVSFLVKSTGAATNVKVKESSGDEGLDRCLTDRLVKWKFPKPRGGVDVAISYPFIFKSLGN